MFAEDGVDAVRVEAIADAADVSVGSVYTHFGNKDGLFVAVAERIVERAAQYMHQAYVVSDSPLEQIAATGETYLNLLLDYPFLIRFMSSNALGVENQAVTGRIGERIASLHAALEERIDAAIAAGEVKPLDSRLLARFLFGAWNGVVGMVTQSEATQLTRQEAEQCLRQARSIVIDGITAPSHLDADGHSTAILHDVPRPDIDPSLAAPVDTRATGGNT